MTTVVLVHLHKPKELMPFKHITGELPKIIQLFSLLDEPIQVRYYQRIDILENGYPVYQQLPHKPSDHFEQPN